MRCSLILLFLMVHLWTGCLYRSTYLLEVPSNGKVRDTREVKSSYYSGHVRLDNFCKGVFHRISIQRSPLNFFLGGEVALEDIELECGEMRNKATKSPRRQRS
jgi:hypothetical protein